MATELVKVCLIQDGVQEEEDEEEERKKSWTLWSSLTSPEESLLIKIIKTEQTSLAADR